MWTAHYANLGGTSSSVQVEDFFDFDDPDPKPGGGGGESDEDLDESVAKQGTEDNPGIIPSPIW